MVKGPDIEWRPSVAMWAGLEIGKEIYPDLSRPELIEFVYLAGLDALQHDHWVKPRAPMSNRDTWAKPTRRVPGR